ncbi:MAG: hypothetical protein IT510_08895 [Sulfuritalea sp.]|nr:hypothetical protein [Sulfuritalea sp.]
MKKTLLALLCTTSLLNPIAYAADKHDHGAKHGGIVQEAGETEFELVVKADSMTLYVFHQEKPLATAGAKAEATLHAGGNKTAAMLTPAGDNKLAAQGSFKTGVGARVAVAVTLPGKPEAKLNFRLK